MWLLHLNRLLVAVKRFKSARFFLATPHHMLQTMCHLRSTVTPSPHSPTLSPSMSRAIPHFQRLSTAKLTQRESLVGTLGHQVLNHQRFQRHLPPQLKPYLQDQCRQQPGLGLCLSMFRRSTSGAKALCTVPLPCLSTVLQGWTLLSQMFLLVAGFSPI